MPKRFTPLPPRNIQSPADAADYARKNLQAVADALSSLVVHDWGALAASQALDIQIADVNVLTLAANVTLTLATAAVPDRTTVRLFATQDDTGSRTVTWAGVTWLNGVTPTLRTTASACDVFEFTFVNSLTTWVGRPLTGFHLTVPGGLAVTGQVALTAQGIFQRVTASTSGGSYPTYGTSEVMAWYRPDGTTVRCYLGFLSNEDQTFFVATQESGDSLVFRTGAGVTALTLNGSQTAAFAAAFACNGATPQTKATLGVAATDLASVIVLANNLRTALINNGIGQL